MNGMSLEDVLGRLDGVRAMGACPQKFAAKCPSHEDRIGSLVVTDGSDKVLMKCHAGCSFAQIVECLGLVEGDLFYGATGRAERNGSISLAGIRPAQAPGVRSTSPVERGRPAGGMSVEQHLVDIWTRDLTDEIAGRLEGLKGWSLKTVRDLGLCLVPGPRPEVGRLGLMNRDADGRVFCYVRYQPNKELLLSSYPKCLAVGPRELYPSPELLPESDFVWLVEGEPDRVSAYELGLNACAVPGIGKWSPEWAPRFKGRRVVVSMDCDEHCCPVALGGGGVVQGSSHCGACGAEKRRPYGGRDHARKIVASLHRAGVDAVMIDLFPGRQDGWDLGDALVAARDDGRVDDLRRYLVRLEGAAWESRAA